MKTIAIDAMGGEHAPQAIVDAMLKVQPKLPDTKFIFFGQEDKIAACLPAEELHNIEIENASEVILDSDEPVKALRHKKDSSLVKAAMSVKTGQADALFSMGNTGALLAAGIFLIGRVKGVKRPALMPTLPATSERGSFNIIDVGANAETKPEYMLQWAKMATIYLQEVEGVAQPKVGLLNNGAESDKGDKLHQTVFQMLKEDPALNFNGNVEGNELLLGKNDLVVTDGFSGNIALKTVEGGTGVLMQQLKDQLLNSGLGVKLGAALVKPALVNLVKKFSTARHGGAVLLGVKAPVVKTHGRSDAKPIYYTLLQIGNMLDHDLIGKFTKEFAQAEGEDND
jgi:glycerol-3-phosphate acyltransferase PlsX